MFIKLYGMAAEKGDDKEMDRCRSIVKQEDRKYMLSLDGLEKVLKETEVEEKKDPKAIKYGKAKAAAKVARAATGMAGVHGVKTSVRRPFFDVRTNSTGSDGPSVCHDALSCRLSGFQTSEPQPMVAIFINFPWGGSG